MTEKPEREMERDYPYIEYPCGCIWAMLPRSMTGGMTWGGPIIDYNWGPEDELCPEHAQQLLDHTEEPCKHEHAVVTEWQMERGYTHARQAVAWHCPDCGEDL